MVSHTNIVHRLADAAQDGGLVVGECRLVERQLRWPPSRELQAGRAVALQSAGRACVGMAVELRSSGYAGPDPTSSSPTDGFPILLRVDPTDRGIRGKVIQKLAAELKEIRNRAAARSIRLWEEHYCDLPRGGASIGRLIQWRTWPIGLPIPASVRGRPDNLNTCWPDPWAAGLG